MQGKAGNDRITEEMVLKELSTVQEPELHGDLVSLGMIKDVAIDGGKVDLTLVLTTMACPKKGQMTDECKEAVMRVPGVEEVTIQLAANTPRHAPGPGGVVQQNLLPTVRNAIAVASGKGGVGKSTVATNIAVCLAADGSRVGLLDADIYGPSVPTMLGVSEQPEILDEERIMPIRMFGVDWMSMGYVIEEGQSVIWRGRMVGMMLQQFMTSVEWGELDYLIIDLPPGTGDAQLTLTQSTQLAGGLVVSTPQAVALADVRRGAAMFEKVEVPVLGVVENMSTYICPNCGHEEHIFDHGGARAEAETLGVPFLGHIPIDLSIRQGGDSGVPVTVGDPDSAVSETFRNLARDLAATVSTQNLARQAAETERASGPRELPMVR